MSDGDVMIQGDTQSDSKVQNDGMSVQSVRRKLTGDFVVHDPERGDRIRFNSSIQAQDRTITVLTDIPASTIEDFSKLFHYMSSTWNKMDFLGVKILKYPTDMWVYQELITEYRPDLIIECGTAYGGSALYMATIMDALKHGKVLTIDIFNDKADLPQHPRIEYITGSSVAADVVQKVSAEANGKTCLLILDSDHRAHHVLAELLTYAHLAAYLVVEDTNLNGFPIFETWGIGPMEALHKFLEMPQGQDWEIDVPRERFFLTQNPGGFVKRKTPTP